MDAAPPALPDVFDRIRAACAEVARRARHVRIDHGRLARYASELPVGAPAPTPPSDQDFRGGEEETAAFVVTLDAVNFGSGWFPALRKLPGRSGYATVATRLADAYHRGEQLDAPRLARLTHAECAALFGQDSAGPASELVGHFTAALNDLGRLVRDEHGGAFGGLVAAAGGSAARLVELLARMPTYRDVSSHDGVEVPLYKRAQITSADLARALGSSPLGRFDDLDRLTLFADNLVPHVLRLDGVLLVDPGLVGRIERGELLTHGSPEEVELRAVSLHAVELLVAELRAVARPTTARELDLLLWTRGGEPAYKAVPRHRARCVYY